MLTLFAQRAGAGNGDAGGLIAGMLAFYAVVLVIAYAIRILFLLSISKCLKQISSRNRRMEPGMVWLALIPLFDIVWFIVIFLKVSDSLKDEFEDRGLRGDGDFGKMLGIMIIVTAFFCGPVGLVCFIMYWVKIAGYTRQLRESGSAGYDDEDDRPRKRSARDDYDDEEEEERPRKKKRRADDYDDE